MFSIATTPAKQSVTDTINVLSSRLGSATLLEDRRASILGLRSFAKDFPATVASSALRGLIGSLAKDGEDVDTVKNVLETLLMLFNPNDDSPEASKEIVLWLADEFTQRQENITLLLDFLDSSDFYSRLYSLQLLSAILSARTERTEEWVFIAPLGVARLVAMLDDQREAIRSEGISLLTGITPSSTDIQKLVAFENAFEKIFSVIEADGSLYEGGRTVEDCLILLANLLRRNSSNQTLLRESGHMKRLGSLLRNSDTEQSDNLKLSAWAETQRNRNIYAFLAVLRLLLSHGSAGTSANQTLLWSIGIGHAIVELAFSHELQVEIRAEALSACGDMIRDAATLQEGFARLTIRPPITITQLVSRQLNGDSKMYVIDGLLELILNQQDSAVFDLRYAACECLKAYFSNHLDIRLHFLGRAIEGYLAGTEESANVLTVILRPNVQQSSVDPYRQWFAATILIHLLYDNPAGKAKALSIAEGDASKGEEVVTSIQTITAHLITGVRRGDDQRVLVGYLMLLIAWLYEDLDAVNDFLSEGSNVSSLIQAMAQSTVVCGEITQGLCAVLLGVSYEFSTKDSPIPRATLHSMLLNRLDRERYLDRLLKLRSHPFLRDYETIPQRRDLSTNNVFPDIYFDSAFVILLKDNFGRFTRAIDRNPEFEISVMANGIQKGISRELVDDLRQQLQQKEQAMAETRAATSLMEMRLGEEQEAHRQTNQKLSRELSEAVSAHEIARKAHVVEVLNLQKQQAASEVEREQKLTKLKDEFLLKNSSYEKQLQLHKAKAEADVEHTQRRANAELADLRATISRLEVDLRKSNREMAQQIQLRDLQLKDKSEEIRTSSEQRAQLESRYKSTIAASNKRIDDLENQIEENHIKLDDATQRAKKAESLLAEAVSAKEAVQSELDDLLIVFADLEDQVAKQKVRLRELGETVSEAEDEATDEEGDDGSGVD